MRVGEVRTRFLWLCAIAVSNRLKSGGDLLDPIWANFIWLRSRIA